MGIGESGRRTGPPRISAESAFLSYLRQLDRHRADRIGVQVRLSLLRPYHRREHHIRAAESCFDSLARRFDGETFALGTGDIVFLGKEASAEDIEPVLARLRYLFGDDPLLCLEHEGGAELSVWYDLAVDYDALLAVAQEAVQHAQAAAGKSSANRRVPAAEPLDAGRLGRIEESLSSADLQSIIRRQLVCRLPLSGPPEPLFQEIFVSIKDLRETVAPSVDLLADRWLFQHLTEVLDRRVLVAVPKLGGNVARGHFSLNLNVATILSPEFRAFEQALPLEARGTIVLELQPIDILADMELFFFARDVARERGYRLCLDGLSRSTLGLLDREQLGFDLVKLQWSPKLEDDPTDRLRLQIEAAVDRTGRANVILCHCDSDQAIELGREVGIAVFQGYRVDSMIQAHRARQSLTKPGRAQG